MATLRDEIRQNPGTFSGTPTLVDSLLVRDTDQATQFDVGDSFTIADSPTIRLLDGAVGGIAIEFSIELAAYPGSDANVLNKSGSWCVQITPTGTVKFLTTGDIVESVASIPLNTKTHVVCVYNGDYSGVTEFGYSTQGSTSVGLEPDFIAGASSGFSNLMVCRFELLEKAQVDTINADLVRFSDHPYTQWVAAVLYGDNASDPGDLLWQSDPLFIDASFATRQWHQWLAPLILYPDFYWLGMIGGNVFSGASEHPVTLIGCENTGGTRQLKNAVVTSGGDYALSGNAPSPFGAEVSSDSKKLSMYADYTAASRTGDEGNLLVYIDGQEDNREPYTAGVTANANSVTGPALACKLDDVVLYDRKLSAVEVARHYAAR